MQYYLFRDQSFTNSYVNPLETQNIVWTLFSLSSRYYYISILADDIALPDTCISNSIALFSINVELVYPVQRHIY
jgi:hypothetical protein